MSSSQTYERQSAQTLTASEINSSHTIRQDGEGERAPKQLVTPLGVAAGRLFVVGTVTDIEDVGGDSRYMRAKVVTPTGAVWVYAGQYQKEAADFLESEVEPPAYLSVTGKPSTFGGEDDDGDVKVSIQPETINEVDATARNLWVNDALRGAVARLQAVNGGESTDIQNALDEAADLYDESVIDEIHAAVTEGLEAETDPSTPTGTEVDEGDSEDSGDDGGEAGDAESGSDIPAVLEEADYNQLRAFASTIEEVNGNGSGDEIRAGLAASDEFDASELA